MVNNTKDWDNISNAAIKMRLQELENKRTQPDLFNPI